MMIRDVLDVRFRMARYPAVFKPPSPADAGGGYMFSGRASVCPSMIHVVVLCFRDISSIC